MQGLTKSDSVAAIEAESLDRSPDTPPIGPKPARKMSNRGRLLAGIAILGLLIGVGYQYAPVSASPERPTVFSVTKGEFTVKVSALGELRALNSVKISAIDDNPVIYLAPEGTNVKKGDLMFRLLDVKYSVAIDESKATLQVANADLRKASTELEAQKQKLFAGIAKFEAEVRLADLALFDLKNRPLPQNLAKARLELDQAMAGLVNSERNRNALPPLVEKGYITRETLDDAELKLSEVKARVLLAQFNFDSISAGATRQELERVTIRVEQAKIALARAKSGMNSQIQSYEASVVRQQAGVERAKALIKKARAKKSKGEAYAPRDGLVVYAHQDGKGVSGEVQLGMIPFQGQALIYLPDLSVMVVDTSINEFDIGKIKVGGLAKVRPQAYPGAVFTGQVYKIGSLAKRKRSASGAATAVKVFSVKVKITESDPRLKPGLTATVDFVTDRREDVITVPLMAVFERANGHGVLVADDDGMIAERKIVLGPSNDSNVVVMEGLNPGDQVVLKLPELGTP